MTGVLLALLSASCAAGSLRPCASVQSFDNDASPAIRQLRRKLVGELEWYLYWTGESIFRSGEPGRNVGLSVAYSTRVVAYCLDEGSNCAVYSRKADGTLLGTNEDWSEKKRPNHDALVQILSHLEAALSKFAGPAKRSSADSPRYFDAVSPILIDPSLRTADVPSVERCYIWRQPRPSTERFNRTSKRPRDYEAFRQALRLELTRMLDWISCNRLEVLIPQFIPEDRFVHVLGKCAIPVSTEWFLIPTYYEGGKWYLGKERFLWTDEQQRLLDLVKRATIEELSIER